MAPITRVVLGTVSAVTLSLPLAACGSGDSGLSKEDFVTKANEICRDADKKTEALAVPTAAADIAPFLAEGIDIQAEALDRLEALEAPKDDADRINSELIEPYRELVEKVRVVQTAAAKAGTDEAKLQQSLAGLQGVDTERPNKFATEYGLTECADDSDEGATSSPAPKPSATP